MKSIQKNTLIIFACIKSITGFAQLTPSLLSDFISDDKNITKAGVKYVSQVKELYEKLNYSTAWMEKQNFPNCSLLLSSLQLCPYLGLKQEEYKYNYIESICNGKIQLKNINDSLAAEIIITDAAIHFYNDLAYGNSKPSFGYYGLKNLPDCKDVVTILAHHINIKSVQLLVYRLSSSLPEINFIENSLRKFSTVMADSSFKEVTITSDKIGAFNIPLVTKLCQLGIIDSVSKNISVDALKQKIKIAQHQFNLLSDGTLRNTTLEELNVPLQTRFQQLTIAINYYRWLHCYMQDQPVVVVNIPAAYLKVYQFNKTILEMRMIVGKKSTPTPALASIINEVILYPYWHVPYNIATRELLPLVKINPAYIDAGNYQVLNKDGKIVNPYSINWHSLSAKNFPYTIRQSTGCDNALGLLKLNFYSPFGVYLHDTPYKTLFMLNKRYLSHGCMRMEKPMDLGHFVLENNSVAIDTLEEKGCLRNQSPVIVPASRPIPVIAWYNPAGIDSLGNIIFYEDVYKKFNWNRKANLKTKVK